MDEHFDTRRWEARLAELAAEHGVPGASLAVLAGGRMHTVATGVVNIETGVEVTPDTLFRVGSTAKVYTATAVMRLVEAGKLDLDAPVVEVLPEFRVADDEITQSVTPRHLLSHTSGIAGDVLLDVGSGDDAVERFVELIADVGADVPLGSIQSYSNTGFVVLGRIMEKLTETVWDDALRELVLEPAGLAFTESRLEDLVRFRATCGHTGEPGKLELEPRMPTMRGMSPAGATLCASAPDIVRFGHAFLNDGVAENGGRLLRADTVAEMLRPQSEVPAPQPGTEHYGLGWALFDWSGRRVIEHGGATFGQRTFFEMVPDRRVAIALLTNSRNQFADILFRELFRELCDLERPAPPAPGPEAGFVDAADADAVVGRYERFGVRVDVHVREYRVVGTEGLTEPLRSQFPHFEDSDFEVWSGGTGDGVYFAREAGGESWDAFVVSERDGERYLYKGGRAQRRVA